MTISGNYWDHVNAVAEHRPEVLDRQHLKGELLPREQALDPEPERITVIALAPSPYASDVDKWQSDAIITVEGADASFGPGGFAIGYIGPNGFSRRETGGELLPGPRAYIYGRAGVVDLFGGTTSEWDRAKEEGRFFAVAPGDTLSIGGEVYTVGLTRAGHPTLEVEV